MDNHYAAYTGIGSRQTPDFAQQLMFDVAVYLAERNITLRSGHADGADLAFERGADSVGGPKEIYLPWSGFNGATQHVGPPPQAWLDLAAKYHPAWNRCKDGAKKLHARNMPQVLGAQLSNPSMFVICWTINASGSGGTGQALRLANDYRISVFDIGNYWSYDEARKYLSQFLQKYIK